MTADVDAYLEELVARLHGVAGDRLRGVYAIGSLALGDYLPGQSDLDVAAFVDVALSLRARHAIVAALEHDALPCPARGLELVLYAAGEAPRYLINLNTGARMAHHVSFDPATDPRFWFVLDLAIARSHALTLFGEPPAEVVPAMPDAAVRSALADALSWYGGNTPGAETVLAACRAWRWATDGVWTSKADAGRWAATRTDAPPVVAEALRAHAAPAAPTDLDPAPTAPPDLDPAAVTAFVDLVRGSL